MSDTCQTTADPAEERGIVCPSCGSAETRVKKTRRNCGGVTARTRVCGCGRRFGTRETVTGGRRGISSPSLKKLAAITPQVQPPVAIISHGHGLRSD